MEDLKNYPLLFLKHCSDLRIVHFLYCQMLKIQVCEINSFLWGWIETIKKNSKNVHGLVFHYLTKTLYTYFIFYKKEVKMSWYIIIFFYYY